jgi:phage shock protein C
MTESKPPPLRRYPDIGWLGGICAGLAYRLGWAPWIIRLILVLLLLIPIGDIPLVLIYILLWIFMPEGPTPEDFEDRTGGSR